MANIITKDFNNQLTSIEELKGYLEKRIEHINKYSGCYTIMEKELNDILEMLG